MADPKKNKTKIQPPVTAQTFPIVGIGASAGGLEAFKQLLSAIPEDSGMAYVLVQHLDPNHESMLPEILQRSTKIPVLEITDDIPLAPNHIYVIPANKMLISTDGILKLSNREKKINTSIDVFFTSLAEVHKECAVGVVLSGTGSDGTIGLKAIKEHGGISIVQDSESASYDSMPQSAVNAGVVDFVLAPEKIPAQLLEINSAYKISHFFKDDEEELPKDDEYIFKQILSLLRQRTGVDFTYYKQPTFHRRIARRIAIVKKNNLTDYLKLLRTDKAEQDALFQDVLIPVTSFFRDPKTFCALAETVFPTILKNKASDEPIRIWIAGCSTGEEAFSIAICLHEYLTLAKEERIKIQIFASDISDKVIKIARTAIYTKADVEPLSEIQLKNYFRKSNGGYEVNKLIRDMCVFAPHNFLKDPPFAKMDLISCRNVLIYMDTFLQKKAFTTFHYALKENGFLLLGRSETAGTSSDLFTQVNKNEKIYSRKSVPGRFLHLANENTFNLQMKDLKTSLSKADAAASSTAGGIDFKKSAEAIMIAKSPASVVINEQMDIVHIHGDTTPFLQAPQGKPTYNLLKMAREGLAFELRNAIHKATKEQETVRRENIPVKANEKQSLVTVEVIPLPDTIEPHYLIRFEKNIIYPEFAEKKYSSRKTIETQKQNEHLEKQLSQTHEDMRSITEDMEAANEELQSANEELQSSNEEMQSLNEELETSKEELQSTNEELIIVNQELLDKQEQLNAARYYSDSIFTTIREPLIVLDKKLRIKTANSSFYKKFNTEENETEGKLFYEIQNCQWDDSEVRSLLENILPKKERLIDFEIVIKFPLLGERHLLMNGLQIKNDNTSEQLILLAIEDITERRIAEQNLETVNISLKEKNELIKASEMRFSNILSQSLMNIAIFKGPEMVVEFANEQMLNGLGKGNAVLNKPLLEGVPELKDQIFPKLLADVYTTGVAYEGFETKAVLVRNGIPVDAYFNFVYQPYRDIDNTITGITVLTTEVTEQVLTKKLIEANAVMIHNIYMSAPASICTFKGPKHVYELVNPAYQKLFDKRDLVGKPLLEALPELIGQGVDKILDNVYNTGEVFTGTEIPIMLARTDNMPPEQLYYNTTMQPIYDEERKIIGVVNFGYDVTEQIMARKQIEASEKRFSNILSQSLMAIAVLKGEEMLVTFANNVIIDIWGKGKDIIGKTLFEVLPEIKDQVFPELLSEVYKTGVHFASSEIKCILYRNGKAEECYFNLIYQPYRDVDDVITGITIIATEITAYVLAKRQILESEHEQVKMARHLKLATDAAKVGVWSLDVASSKLEWSDIHKKIWGYDEYRQDLTYEDWYSIIFPEDREIAFQRIEESRILHSIYDVDYRIRRANDGATIWIKSTGQFQYDEFGVAHTLSGISIDISEQKRLDEELLEAKSKAEIEKELAINATMAKQQFLSNMSHEIRTPMNAIVGFTKVLLKTDITEKQKEYLNAIKTSGDTLIVLINDILDLAKVDEGKMSFVNAPFKMAESVKVISHLFQTKIEENNLELVREYDAKIPEILLGDVVRLHQILINLLGNAVKFTKKGKITLSVNLLKEDKKSITLEIKVSDTGIGIPKNKINTIFEKFEQAENTTSGLYGGTGLGLAIVKQLVEKQGGTISVESKINKGSTFSFILSFQKTNTEMVENVPVLENPKTENMPLKILVVEDVKLNQLLMRTILDDFQFEYDIADNGKIAVEKLENNTYDIILMDLQMPIMNGFEATEHIRKVMNLKIPIIALTADVTTVDVEKCKAVGMNDYVSKPLDEEILHRKILELVKRK